MGMIQGDDQIAQLQVKGSINQHFTTARKWKNMAGQKGKLP
jgi:hypothetical protein